MRILKTAIISLIFILSAAVTAYGEDIKVTWDEESDASGYFLYISETKDGEYFLYDMCEGSSNTEYMISDAEDDRAYWIKVASYDISDGSFRLGEKSEEKGYAVTPDSPSEVSASGISCDEMKITWNKVEDADGYKVYRYSSEKKKYILIKTIRGEKTEYTDKGLKSDSTSTYRVAAFVTYDGTDFTGEKSDKAKGKTLKSKGIDKLMETAEGKLGKRYVSGAAGPNSFDCSGFVHWVFSKAKVSDVKFSRSSALGIYKSLKKYDIGSTSLSDAKKGDILFFGSSRTNIWHTSIYYGNKKHIHAFSTWGKVAVNSVSMSTSNKKLVAIVRLPLN